MERITSQINNVNGSSRHLKEMLFRSVDCDKMVCIGELAL